MTRNAHPLLLEALKSMNQPTPAEKAWLAVTRILVVVITLFGGSWLLMVIVSILHGWWPTIPIMPYGVALAITGVRIVASMVGTMLKQAAKL